MELAGKSIIVTGGGRGIGQAIALASAREGASVVVADLGAAIDGAGTEPSVADATVDMITACGGRAVATSETVATKAGARAIVDAALSTWGRLDGVVCCAGILRHRPFLELTEADFDAVIATHLKGHFLMFQTAMAAMVSRGNGGSLIGLGSGYVLGDPSRAPYRSAKAGIVGLTKSVALAGAEHGIRANVISPIADTRMTAASNLSIGSGPEHIAPMAVYLLSDRSAGVTGEVFSVSGPVISSWREPEEHRSVRGQTSWSNEGIAGVVPWLLAEARDSRRTPPPLPPEFRPNNAE